MPYEGGCLCGRVRYCIDGEPLSAGYCHCRMCQRAAGAPVVAWVAFRRAGFRFVAGSPDVYQASPRAVRRFCGHCGSALTFEYAGGTDSVDVTIASLDDPSAAEPIYQIWTADKLPWLHLEGRGPQYPGDAPEGKLH
jgi:hypothetical protein